MNVLSISMLHHFSVGLCLFFERSMFMFPSSFLTKNKAKIGRGDHLRHKCKKRKTKSIILIRTKQARCCASWWNWVTARQTSKEAGEDEEQKLQQRHKQGEQFPNKALITSKTTSNTRTVYVYAEKRAGKKRRRHESLFETQTVVFHRWRYHSIF